MNQEFLRVLKLESEALAQTAERLSQPDSQLQINQTIQALNQTLDRGGKIILTGVGKSGKIAQKISATMTSTGSFSVFLHPTEALHGDMGVVQKNDSIIALSQTGNSDEIIRFVSAIKNKVGSIIALTARSDSELARSSNTWINTTVNQEACPHNLAPTASTTVMLAIGDAIAVTLMKLRKFESTQFAENHPGGALGRKLTATVKDLMHTLKNIAVVSPNASATEVIESSTQKKLGAVAVIDHEQFIGLITDGDIRRALGHHEKFFKLQAKDFMTKNPVTINPDSMAQDALHMMESRSSQISVLPVVDRDNPQQLLGMIRLHDLIRTL